MTNQMHPPMPETQLDVTGLPDPVVEDLRRLVQTLETSLTAEVSPPPITNRSSLRGRFAASNLSIPREAIDEARREVWSGFPREFPETDQP